ncbi:MAG TPA: Xaa-Pro peptidase family protein [Rectinemataceae bacterium]|nr:Xaa-Pro peptidase family protein [Rectinemataceae bacterium]
MNREKNASMKTLLRAAMAEAGLDALLVTRDANQRFVEGYTGSECYLLVSKNENWLIADSRYTEQASDECASAKVVRHRDPFPPYDEVIASLAAGAGLRRIGFERSLLSYAQYDAIGTELGKKGGIEFIPTENIVEKLRMVKNSEEISFLRRACTITDLSLERAVANLREGMSEVELTRELEARIVELGGDGPGSSTIVAFGARPSLPHAVPLAGSKLKKGDFILIDFGVSIEGYRSDMTRTVVFGRASLEQKKVYAAVLESQMKSVEAMVAGASGKTPDAVARESVRASGYPEFGYGVGHGVGLEIHEMPFMSRRCAETLENGMVITCEPGIYIPGWGGVRVEDTVLIRDGNPECLTRFPKDKLLEI